MGPGTGGPSGGEEAFVRELSFSTVERGVSSGIRERAQRVIGTVEEWRALWASHYSTALSPPPLPPIDFSREMIIAVFMGEQRTGGFSLEIKKVEEREGRLQVPFLEHSPAPGSPVLQVLTQPYHMIRLPRTELPVQIVRQSPD